MSRWRSFSKSWKLGLGATFIVGGLILYAGYQSPLAQSSQEREQKITREKVQAVSVQTQTAEQAAEQAQVPVAQKAGDMGSASAQTDSGKKALDIKDFPSPVHGSILRNVGNYYSESLQDYLFHAGTDYAEPEGTIIRATHGGKVVSIGLDSVLGQKVTLDCGEGWVVTYGGLDNLRVQDGETVVSQGMLGQVGFYPGAEGQSAQSHLHYEVWHDDEVQRP